MPVPVRMTTRPGRRRLPALPTETSSWRGDTSLDHWLRMRGQAGIAGIDTRRLTRRIRQRGMPHAAILDRASGTADPRGTAIRAARSFKGILGADLALAVSHRDIGAFGDDARWSWHAESTRPDAQRRVAVLDFGATQNIPRSLAAAGCHGRIHPADATDEDILSENPDGILISNGPADPAARGQCAVATIRNVLDRGYSGLRHLPWPPDPGSCPGRAHHRVAPWPSRRKPSGPGIAFRAGFGGIHEPGIRTRSDPLPLRGKETHRFLFNGSICGIRAPDCPAFSVQFDPEASPGLQDRFGLLDHFADLMDAAGDRA